MIRGLGAVARRGDHASRDRRIPVGTAGVCVNRRRPAMQWQTPTATDYRFGFEITMYVTAR